MYTAVILDHFSSEFLKQIATNLKLTGFLFETSSGIRLPHHMTINLGLCDSGLNPLSILDQEATLTVKDLIWSTEMGVCAAPVHEAAIGEEKLNVWNYYPHITVCLRAGIKPRVSNDLLKNFYENETGRSFEFEETKLTGIITQVH